jgi:hypothetical protein
MSDKIKRDDQTKAHHADAEPARNPTARHLDEDEDKLGGLASMQEHLPPGERAQMNNSLDVVSNSFLWLNDATKDELAMLKEHLLKEDAPPWYASLVDSLLQVALGAGSAGIGLHIANKLVPVPEPIGKATGAPVTNEFVKGLFEQGINAGVAAGRAELGSTDRSETISSFVKAQMEGVREMHYENQRQFTHVGRYQVQSLEQARSLEAACSKANLREAARKQYQASRDTWVSYLAQAKFGARSARGPVQPEHVNVGPTTTNLSTEDTRDRTNAGLDRNFVPADAPSFAGAVNGEVPGVLSILASLPRITGSHMDGTPQVAAAFLNGVNSTIRNQYQGTPLAQMTIPRHIDARAEGMPDFRVNVDEAGTATLDDRRHGAWLRARAGVDHSESWGASAHEQQQIGIAKLLRDLVPTKIRGGGS